MVRLGLMIVALVAWGAGEALAQGGQRTYDTGSPSLIEIWVDPVLGDDSRQGTSRSTAVRTVDRAWRMIPVNTPGTPFTGSGYHIRLVAGTYPEANLPNYWDERYGSWSAPIVIEAADGPRTAIFQGDINMAQVAYVYFIDLDIVPAPAGDAFHCEACDHILIRNGRFIGGTWSRDNPPSALAHETLKINQSTHVYIEDSELKGAGDNALDFVAVQYGHVVRSRIGNANDWCAYAKGGSAYLVFDGNTFEDCGTGGFIAGQGTGFQFMTSPWTHYEAYGITAINNLVRNVDGAGMGVNGGFNILLAWNTMVNVGRRSHLLEIGYGSRSCDGVPGAPDRERCSSFLAAGGWGTTVVDDGSNYVRIPNRHVFIVNNLVYNPDGAASEYQHFAIPGPFTGPSQSGSNVPSPASADTDLRILGNVIWNGSSTHALGLGDDSGCQPANPTCNASQILAQNSINTVRPVFANEGGGDFRVAAGTLPAPAAIPAFIWSDAPTTPSAPAGVTRETIGVDFAGVLREANNHAGAWVPTRPAITVNPTTVRFAATRNGASAGVLTSKTPPQVVSVSFPSGAPTWTVVADQPWVDLRLSPTTRTGAATFVVDILNPTGPETSLSATLTVTTAGGTHTPQTITVLLSVDDSNGAATNIPVGQVDTPTQNRDGVQGAIGVTGWALDDVGVDRVEVFRNCLPSDNPLSCQSVLGYSVVFIGRATILSGARPDVENAFRHMPMSNRAGWGYLILTPMLPHVDGGRPFGGQGSITLYAIATDMEGRRALLGRAANPASPGFAAPTVITMANDSIAKPFGAIDTPGQGATTSGIMNNFGWAVTPDSNTTAGDPGDVIIPRDGSTMTVFIDGVPRGTVAYNHCRGSVGTPPPAGVFCNDDVSNIFGNPAPLAAFTTRTSNPTLFRNLDAAGGAIGVFSIDTTTLTNGLHTIAWSVTDSLGRTEGIGSRFFNVLNSGAGDHRVSDLVLRAAPARVVGVTAALDVLPVGTEGVWGRTGFDPMEPWSELEPERDGTYRATVNEMTRIELWFGASVTAGHLVTVDGLRPLPTGATLYGPRFSWIPPVGYVGDYRLVFTRGAERIEAVISIR